MARFDAAAELRAIQAEAETALLLNPHPVVVDRTRPRRSRARARAERRDEQAAAELPLPSGCELAGPKGVHLYPKRERCVACRNYFAWTILDRLYCSRECAGLGPEPAIEDAPRECVIPAGKTGELIWKSRFPTPEAASKVRSGAQTIYHCRNCHYFHVGTRRNSR